MFADIEARLAYLKWLGEMSARNEFSVFGTDTGRMCVAALNSKNIDYVCASIAKVV